MSVIEAVPDAVGKGTTYYFTRKDKRTRLSCGPDGPKVCWRSPKCGKPAVYIMHTKYLKHWAKYSYHPICKDCWEDVKGETKYPHTIVGLVGK